MKISKFLLDSKYRFCYLSSFGFYNWMGDEKYLKKKFYAKMGVDLDLDNPEAFNEKLQWLKLHDKKDIYTTMVDKYEAKKYVADKIGEEYIIPTLGVYDKFDEIDFDKLPNQFIMKCTHDSGGIVVCKDKANLNIAATKKKVNKALKRNFYYTGREWPYKNVKPRIIIEKYMGDDLVDYRFYCFSGVPKYVYQYISESQADNSKPEPAHCNIYDMNWELQDFHQASLPSAKKYAAPKNFKKMIELAKILSKGVPFLRVDFYEISGKAYFGELTFYPGAGFSEFHPEEWDKKFGDLLDLNSVK